MYFYLQNLATLVGKERRHLRRMEGIRSERTQPPVLGGDFPESPGGHGKPVGREQAPALADPWQRPPWGSAGVWSCLP